MEKLIDKKSYCELMAEDVKLEDLPPSRYQLERRRAEIVVDLLQASEGRLEILDIGCGDGLQLSLVRRTNPQAALVGLDLSEKRLARAEQRVHALKTACADIEKGVPFSTASFDRVICSEVIEHLVKPEDFLSEVRRVLRPGGLLVLSMPYRQQLQWVRCIHCGRMTSEHLHSFDEAGTKRLLESAGLQVELMQTPRLYKLALTAFLSFKAWRRVHHFLELTWLRKYKPPYLIVLARQGSS